jgi:hypothetical protein
VNGEQAPMVYPGKEKRGRFKGSDYILAAAGMRVGASYSGAADDLRLADEWEAQARTKMRCCSLFYPIPPRPPVSRPVHPSSSF